MRRVPIGLCEDYPEENRTLAELRRDFDLMAASGIDVLRVSIGWDGVEPDKDRYELDFVDDLVELAQARGVRLAPYVASTPGWNVDGSAADAWKRPPRDPAQLGELMELLARRYRGRIPSWEIWNAPDNRDHWTGTADEYAALLEIGAAGVRRGDPGAKVVSGGLAGNVEFLRALVPRLSVADVVNVHASFETRNGQPLERLPAYLDEVAEMIRPTGRPIWLAEVGYSTHREGATVSPHYAAAFAHEHTPAFQAHALVRLLMLALASPHVGLVAWYELKDPRPDARVIGDANNRHLGLSSADHRPKPALGALTFFARLFRGGFAPLDVRVERPADPPTETRTFLLADGMAVVTAWIPNPSGPQRRFYTGDDPDRRRASLSVTLPCAGGDRGVLLDPSGAAREIVAGARSGGWLRLGPIELRGGDTAIVVVAACQRRR
jgi:hypothetical protein